MSPESPISPVWISGHPGNKESRKSSISIDTGLWTSPESRPPKPVRILLGETASKALLAAGECFIIGGKSSLPDPAGRVTLHLCPIDKDTADKICGVLMGTHRISKIKTPSTKP